MNSNPLFPIFLKLDQLNTLIVGGGNVALEKVSAMLRNSPDAKITMVAPFFREETLTFIYRYPQVKWKTQPFSSLDLDEMDLVVCTTDNYKLHEEIKALCVARHLMCNVADTPPLCDFYLGSIVQKGDLKIAISTNGKSPTLAKRIKVFLSDVIPDNIQDSMDHLELLRKDLKGDFEAKINALNDLTRDLIYRNKKDVK